jgi:hypothetical protein
MTGADIAVASGMARIRSIQTADRTRVVIAGQLTVADMARLERACSTGLTSRPPRLDIDLRHVTHTDVTAATLLRCLEHLGAIVTRVTVPTSSRQ